MQRRDFIKYGSAFALSAAFPNTFSKAFAAQSAFTIYGAPAMPSLTIAVAALQGQLAKQQPVDLKFGVIQTNYVRVLQAVNLK